MNLKGLVNPSDFVASDNKEKCSQCGICVDRCHFGARILDQNNDTILKQDLCFGCGLCATTCPEGSIELTAR